MPAIDYSFLIMMVVMIGAFYFLIMRPQIQQQKRHKAMIEAIKRGDTVTLSNGMIAMYTGD